jgi:hypothetical protein
MAQIPNRIQESYDLYCAFCDEVVAPLLREQVPFPPEMIARMEQITGKKFPIPKKKDP